MLPTSVGSVEYSAWLFTEAEPSGGAIFVKRLESNSEAGSGDGGGGDDDEGGGRGGGVWDNPDGGSLG